MQVQDSVDIRYMVVNNAVSNRCVRTVHGTDSLTLTRLSFGNNIRFPAASYVAVDMKSNIDQSVFQINKPNDTSTTSSTMKCRQ